MNQTAIPPQGTPDITSLLSVSQDLGISEFLAFKLGDEEYGIDILWVQEIRSFERPTGMANALEHILGALNLRGVIVPIVDMRIKFNLSAVNDNTLTVVIVLNIGTRVVGMVVDGVSDVINLSPEQLRPVPELSSAIGNDHLLAIGSLENRMLILVDIDKLMSSPEIRVVERPTLMGTNGSRCLSNSSTTQYEHKWEPT